MAAGSAAKKTVAIVTASSTSGSSTIQHLLKRYAGAVNVRAVYRTEGKVDAALRGAEGVEIVTGVDAYRPESLEGAFRGASAALIVTPEDAKRGMADDALLTKNMVEVAVSQGVEHIVYAGSWTVVAADEVKTIAGRFVPTEKLLAELGEEKGLKWTSLRLGFFYDNFAASFRPLKTGDAIVAPTYTLPAVDPRDLGRVAARVLVDGPAAHHAKHYNICGPENLSVADIAAVFARVLERPITHTPIPVAALEGRAPPYLVELMRYLNARGADAVPFSPDVQAVTGERPTYLVEWLHENKHLFARA